MNDPVVAAAQLAFAQRLRDSSDVSDNTRNAQAIAKSWRSAVYKCDPDRYQTEEEWGRRYLDTPMPREYMKYLESQGLVVEVAYVQHS